MAPRRRTNREAVDIYSPAHFGIEMDSEDLDRAFAVNARRPMEPTRFFERQALDALGVYEEVYRLFNNIGWGQLVTESWRTYRGVTLEFLTSLKVTHRGRSFPVSIDFQAGRLDYTISVDGINDTFDAPHGGCYLKSPGFDAAAFWALISGPNHQRYKSGYSTTTMVCNPAFRIVLKMLSHTVFARKENTHVTKSELLVLWCMIQSKSVNVAQYLVAQLQKQANSDRSSVVIGGMITAILAGCDWEEEGQVPLEGSTVVDLRSLVNMHYIKEVTPPFWFVIFGEKPFPLPNEALVYTADFGARTNWKMNTEAHRQTTADAERAFNHPPWELEVFEGGDDDGHRRDDHMETPDEEPPHQERPHVEVPHQEQPRSSFHRGEGSSSHRRRRPTMEEQIEELQQGFHGLSTRFDTFVVDQRAEWQQRRSFEEEQRTEWQQRRSFEDEQRNEWARNVEQQRLMYEWMTRHNSFPPPPS